MSKKIKFSKRRKSLTPSARRRPNISFEDLDCRNVEVLKKFVTEQGKILSRQYTGLPAHFQRRLAKAIKRARNVLLMK
jgi:small subunit ribosomal protein S18